MKKYISQFISSGWVIIALVLVALTFGMYMIFFDVQRGWPFLLYIVFLAILGLFGLIWGLSILSAIMLVVIEKVREFLNPPLPESDSSRTFSIGKKRQRDLEVEHYRMEKFWKPLWKLFLIVCVIYTVLNVLQIDPSSSGGLYENLEW